MPSSNMGFATYGLTHMGRTFVFQLSSISLPMLTKNECSHECKSLTVSGYSIERAAPKINTN
jgi:hypothetical protein